MTITLRAKLDALWSDCAIAVFYFREDIRIMHESHISSVNSCKEEIKRKSVNVYDDFKKCHKEIN